MMIIKFVDL